MFVELEGIGQADAIVRQVVGLVAAHDVVIDALDVDVGNIVSQEDYFVAMNLVLVLAPQVFLLDESALHQASDECARSHKGVEDVYILLSQRRVEVLTQDVLDRMDDEIHALHRRIDNAKFLHGERECALEELLVEVLDDGLLALQVVDVAHVDPHRLVELIQHLCVHLKAFRFEKLQHELHRLAHRVVVDKLIVVEQGIEHGPHNHVLGQHLDGLSLIHTRIDVALQTCHKLLEVLTGSRILLHHPCDAFDKLAGYFSD